MISPFHIQETRQRRVVRCRRQQPQGVLSDAAYSERSKNMSTRKLFGIVILTVIVTTVAKTWGQRGMGDNEGVVRQAVQTQRIMIEGTLKEIVPEQAENTPRRV